MAAKEAEYDDNDDVAFVLTDDDDDDDLDGDCRRETFPAADPLRCFDVDADDDEDDDEEEEEDDDDDNDDDDDDDDGGTPRFRREISAVRGICAESSAWSSIDLRGLDFR